MAKIKVQKSKTGVLEEYSLTFGHPPAPEEMRDLGHLEVEKKAKVALRRNKPVKAWLERSQTMMGTPMDRLYGVNPAKVEII